MIDSKYELKINFVDFWASFDKMDNFISRILSRNYKLILSDTPDILICSHFGQKHKLYKDCKKVLYMTENPLFFPVDHNDYDYAFGYPYSDDDRFCHVSLLYWYHNAEEIQNREKFSDNSLANRKFCNFIYSNGFRGGGHAYDRISVVNSAVIKKWIVRAECLTI